MDQSDGESAGTKGSEASGQHTFILEDKIKTLTDRVEAWSTLASNRCKTIRAQRIKIRKLEKRIAQSKWPAKIREEILVLEEKRDTADKKIEEENQAYETRDHEIKMELEERRRELEMHEEDYGEEC